MTDDRYRQIFDELTRDLYAVTKRHGKRALREAVRDAARGELLQEEDDIPPEDLDYPSEDVLTLPPPPEERREEDSKEAGGDEEQSSDDGDENKLSEAAEQVASELAEKLERRLRS